MVGSSLLLRATHVGRLSDSSGVVVDLRYVTAVAWIGLLSVSAALCYALVAGNFHLDGASLLENPWGVATLVDIYVGFALFSCWIAWREPRLISAIAWIALVMMGGNLVSTVYVLVALRSSGGNIQIFWHGKEHVTPKAESGVQAIESRKRHS